jgi:cyclin H
MYLFTLLTRPQEAQISLGHEFADPPPSQAYLSVEDELCLLHFYTAQTSAMCRKGLGLPEVVEGTAITYLKRFYLKNSVMEWHPKSIMWVS